MVEPLHVLRQTEDSALVDPNAFKDPVPVEKSVVKYRDPSLRRRHKVSIHIHVHTTSG